MPPLNDPRHETFARLVASGKTKREAAIEAGFGGKFASATGSKLAKASKIGQRIEELQAKVAEKTVSRVLKATDFEISAKIKRIQALDWRWQKIRQVIEERGADPTMAEIPGGTTGLLVRQIKSVGQGRDAQLIEEYAFDAALLKEARAHEEQAAKELGQIVTKSEITGKDGGPIELAAVDARDRIEQRLARLAPRITAGDGTTVNTQ